MHWTVFSPTGLWTSWGQGLFYFWVGLAYSRCPAILYQMCLFAIPCIQMNHESYITVFYKKGPCFICFCTEPLCAKARAQCLIKVCWLSKRRKEGKELFSEPEAFSFYSWLASKRKPQGLRLLLGYRTSSLLLFALISAISTQSTNPTSKSFISFISKMEENYSEIN